MNANYEQPNQQQPPLSRIEVTASYPPIMFFYALVSPIIEINGYKQTYPWGTQYFDVPQGDYEVAVSYQWLFGGWGRMLFASGLGPRRRGAFGTRPATSDFCRALSICLNFGLYSKGFRIDGTFRSVPSFE